jgi:hypothetical protein
MNFMASRSIVSRLAFVAAFAVASLLTTLASADAIAPDEGACTGKAAGATCTIDTAPVKSGTCEDSTCAHLVYFPDGGHGSEDKACLLCNTDGAQDAGADGSPADAAHALGAEPPTTPASTSSSSCSVASAIGMKAAAPLSLAAVVPLGILLLGRRRRRS